MKRKIRFSFSNISWLLLFCCVGLLLPQVSGAADNSLKVGGYVRTWASFNLSDSLETSEDDLLEPSMLRGSAKLDLQGKQGMFTFKMVGRFDGELETDYLRNANSETRRTERWFTQLAKEATTFVSPTSSFLPSLMAGNPGAALEGNDYTIQGDAHDIMDEYNNAELREAYIEFDPCERVTLRLGKQQVVWGETDFFRAMDVVHGFEYRWRSFMEPENEELRKPLILANIMIDFPEIASALQLLVRPGWDQEEQIGNRHALGGSRWSSSPYLGLDFRDVLDYNYRYKDGDAKKPTGGARWNGVLGPVEYSLNYLKTFNDDFIINSRTDPKHDEVTGIVGDFVHPYIDIYGFTLNGYVPFLDSVLSTEIAYTPNKPYTSGCGNVTGTSANFYFPADSTDANVLDDLVNTLGLPTVNALLVASGYPAIDTPTIALGDVANLLSLPLFGSGDLKVNPALENIPVSDLIYVEGDTIVLNNRKYGLVDIPGFAGIKRKDTLMMMFRVDKVLRCLEPLLKTGAPPFFTVQFFDQWIMNFDRDDELIIAPPYGSRKKEHSSIITGVLMLEYMNQSIKPQLAGGYDITYSGGFFFPSCEFIFGDHWRLRAEADFFFVPASKDYSSTEIAPLQSGTAGDLGLSILNLANTDPVTGGIHKDIENNAKFFGLMNRRDQFLLRLTYQF